MAKRPPRPDAVTKKPDPPPASWWTAQVSRDRWYQLAKDQADRLQGSQGAKDVGHRRTLDDYQLGQKWR